MPSQKMVHDRVKDRNRMGLEGTGTLFGVWPDLLGHYMKDFFSKAQSAFGCCLRQTLLLLSFFLSVCATGGAMGFHALVVRLTGKHSSSRFADRVYYSATANSPVWLGASNRQRPQSVG